MLTVALLSSYKGTYTIIKNHCRKFCEFLIAQNFWLKTIFSDPCVLKRLAELNIERSCSLLCFFVDRFIRSKETFDLEQRKCKVWNFSLAKKKVEVKSVSNSTRFLIGAQFLAKKWFNSFHSPRKVQKFIGNILELEKSNRNLKKPQFSVFRTTENWGFFRFLFDFSSYRIFPMNLWTLYEV